MGIFFRDGLVSGWNSCLDRYRMEIMGGGECDLCPSATVYFDFYIESDIFRATS